MLYFPLKNCNGIPVGKHPGAFGYRRKHDIHTGVDLYTKEGEEVSAMEDGIVTSIEWFTGPNDNSPWWQNTQAICIEGQKFVICYGELKPIENLKEGQKIKANQVIGTIAPVVNTIHPEIPGHSNCMLHIELYTKDRKKASDPWHLDKLQHDYLLDPTSYLTRFQNKILLEYPLTSEEIWEGIEDGMDISDVITNIASKRYRTLSKNSYLFCIRNTDKITDCLNSFVKEGKLSWTSIWTLKKND